MALKHARAAMSLLASGLQPQAQQVQQAPVQQPRPQPSPAPQPGGQAAPAAQPAAPQPATPAAPAGPKPPSPEKIQKEQDKVMEEARTRELWVGLEECLQEMDVNDLTTLADAIAADPDLLGSIIGETLAAKTREPPSLSRVLEQEARRVKPARRAMATLAAAVTRAP